MAVTSQIPRAAFGWILAFMLMLLLPHALRLPLWISGFCVFCMTWRVGVHLEKFSRPGRLLRVLIIMVVVPAIFLQYQGTAEAIDISVGLLLTGASLKLLEMRDRRDVYIVIALGFLLLMVGFIYSQNIPIAAYNLLVMLVLVSCMVSMNSPETAQLKHLKLASVMVLQCLPLMLVMFLLVPRVAPLWAMPLPAGASQTGISEAMTPGDISRLGRSGELAFRVKFTGEPPANEALYWRGLVLDHFDGRTWSRSRGSLPTQGDVSYPESDLDADILEYDIILEPTRQPWLFGIKMAEARSAGVFLDRNDTLVSSRPVNQRLRYQLRSHPSATHDRQLSRRSLAEALQLPGTGNPKTQAYARELRQRHVSDLDLVMAILQLFREEDFFYTLTPPILSEASIDDFLFQTREGFCAHYAGSMTYLLRAAGIPARVVVGYQGGEFNRFDEYLMIYQYNAHAWTEVWLEGHGWLRFDPTAWVAPDRIIQGAESFFAESSGFLEETPFSFLRFRDTPWLNTLRLQLDAMDYAWNRWVISYDTDLQLQFLGRLLGDNARKWGLSLLFVLMGSLISLLAFWLWWQRRKDALETIERDYLKFCRDMAGYGFERRVGEGPQAYARRLATEQPQLEDMLCQVEQLINQSLYAVSDQKQQVRDLRELSNRLLRHFKTERKISPS